MESRSASNVILSQNIPRNEPPPSPVAPSGAKFSFAPVNPKEHLARGTRRHELLGYLVLLVVAPIAFIALTFSTYGIGLVVLFIWLCFARLRDRRARATIMGSSLKVSPDQFSVIDASVKRLAQRLGMKNCPDLYIVEDNTQNASAMKIGSKHYITLIDDIVYGAHATGNPEALDFIIGHELAHHALGHTTPLRSLLARKYHTLSRLDEFSCDAVSRALTNEKAAQDALSLLVTGPQLYSYTNRDALTEQAREVINDRHTKGAEKYLSHPLLLHRYARVSSAL